MSSEPGRSPIDPRSHEKAPVPSPSAVLLGDLWGAPEWLQDAVVDATYGALA